MKNQKTYLLFLFLLCVSQVLLGSIKIENLRVEYTREPIGLDVEKPRFSWILTSLTNERGISQSAYQIAVINEDGRTVWNSGKVKSDVSLNIPYEGEALDAVTRYNWTVTVWNQKNKKYTSGSFFETGFLNSSISAWSGAKWIGGGDEDLVLYASYLPVFCLNYSFELDQSSLSTKASFIYGANDERLMNENKNLFHLQNAKNESYIKLEIDISSLPKEEALLNVYRVGYHPDDTENTPFKSFKIPFSVINEQNKYHKHTLFLSSNLGYSHFYVDGQEQNNRVGEVNLNPLGQGGDFIAFPMVADIGFSMSTNQKATFSDIEIRNYKTPGNVLAKKFSPASSPFLSTDGDTYLVKGDNSGCFMTFDPSQNSMPMLRTLFTSKTKNKVSKARLYVTSRGIYEVYMNGEKIGDDYFNPGLTQYNKTHLYQTYDVTQSILSGKNVLGVLMAEGWWSGAATFVGDHWNFFGDRQSLLLKLVVTYDNGEEQVIVSDSTSWKYNNDGPVLYGSFFQGEVFDARKDEALKGWNTTSFDDSSWKNAVEVPLEGTISTYGEPNLPYVNDYSNHLIIGQLGETVKKIKELTAVSVEEVRPGVFVYDMGQNMVGVPKISLNGLNPGERICLRFAEMKYPDLPEYKESVNMIMLENIRAAMAQDIYITKGESETIQPRFTFHGYRFVEITGIENALPLESVKGLVLSSIQELSSSYATSNAKVNKLWENIIWSTYGNFLSIPTDCPQRNERLGWSGDISVFSRSATYLSDVAQFLRKHMLAMRDVQREDGRFTDVAPLGGGFGSILWGSAGITVPWELYQQYNDKVLLTEHYDAMKAYVEYLKRYICPNTGVMTEGNLGDWLGPEQEKNDNTLLWEAYFIYDLQLLSKMASVLGKDTDALAFEELYRKRKAFFNSVYVDPITKKTIHSGFKQHPHSKMQKGDVIDTQTSYILPLAFDVFNEENKSKALINFIKTVEREHIADNGQYCPPYSLMTGFIGTAWICKVLSDNGYTDVAYKLLQQTQYPSWLYSVEQGATTIWERLNSYTHTNGFGGNNRMNSFNHYSFGAVASWMYNYSLGIQRDEKSPGFKHFILQPEVDTNGEMTYVKGHYDSMYGRIESAWEVSGEKCFYSFIIPANSSATLYLKSPFENEVSRNDVTFNSMKGVKYVGEKEGVLQYKLASGTYYITLKKQ